MNLLKAVFGGNESEQMTAGHCVYRELKQWDRKRAEILEKHLRVTQAVLIALDRKIVQS